MLSFVIEVSNNLWRCINSLYPTNFLEAEEEKVNQSSHHFQLRLMAHWQILCLVQTDHHDSLSYHNSLRFSSFQSQFFKTWASLTFLTFLTIERVYCKKSQSKEAWINGARDLVQLFLFNAVHQKACLWRVLERWYLRQTSGFQRSCRSSSPLPPILYSSCLRWQPSRWLTLRH